MTEPYRVDALSIEDGMAMAMWRYPGPWAVYDSLEAPPPDEGWWAVRDADGGLIGFCCFGEAARVPGLGEAPRTRQLGGTSHRSSPGQAQPSVTESSLYSTERDYLKGFPCTTACRSTERNEP